MITEALAENVDPAWMARAALGVCASQKTGSDIALRVHRLLPVIT